MSILANSGNTSLKYVYEDEFGVIPASTPRSLRYVSETLKFGVSKVGSQALNPYRAVSRMHKVEASVSGNIAGEFQYAEYDELLEATLMNTFWNAVGSGTVTMNSTTISGTGIGIGLFKGQFFQATGTGNTNVDGKVFRVDRDTEPTDNLITLDSNTPGVSGTFNGFTVASSRLVNGDFVPSYTIERQHSDVSEYMSYSGMIANTLGLTVTTSGITAVGFGFIGKMCDRSGSTHFTGTPDSSYTYDAESGLSSFSGMNSVVWFDGAPISDIYVRSIKLNYGNNLRAQNTWCDIATASIGVGNISAKITLELYMKVNCPFLQELQRNVKKELSFYTVDPTGNGYVFTLPGAVVLDWQTGTSGNDTDIVATVDLSCHKNEGDTGLTSVLIIDRIGTPLLGNWAPKILTVTGSADAQIVNAGPWFVKSEGLIDLATTNSNATVLGDGTWIIQ